MKRWHFVFCSISLTIRSRFVTLCSLTCGPNSDYCRLPTIVVQTRNLWPTMFVLSKLQVQQLFLYARPIWILCQYSYVIFIAKNSVIYLVILTCHFLSACINAYTPLRTRFVLRCSVCFITLLACGCLSVHSGSVRPERTPPALWENYKCHSPLF